MEVKVMAGASRKDYLRSIYERYRKASRTEKSRILDEFCKGCGYRRKYAIWLLSRPLENARIQKTKALRTRKPRFSEAAVRMLALIWRASGYLCSQRLKPALAHWIHWASKRWDLSDELKREILSISSRQMDRRLKPYKIKAKRKIYGTTKPGSLLKRMIPVRTDFWDVKKAGFSEIDLVSHSGASADGEFIYTLNSTDIKTTWIERRAIMGKSKEAVVRAMVEIESNLPFDLLGIDSDNGSEFINEHLYAFCRQRVGRKVCFTRSREYKKDDNAHIEQKNWTHVRKLLGWDRYDTPAALEAINEVYEDLRIFQNLFQPSMKLVKKVRKGARLIRRYDCARTPLERVEACGQAGADKLARLKRFYESTDPFELSERIDQGLARIYKLASRGGMRPREKTPAKATGSWMRSTFKRGTFLRRQKEGNKALLASLAQD